MYQKLTGKIIKTINPCAGSADNVVYYPDALSNCSDDSIMGLINEMIIERRSQPFTIWIKEVNASS